MSVRPPSSASAFHRNCPLWFRNGPNLQLSHLEHYCSWRPRLDYWGSPLNLELPCAWRGFEFEKVFRELLAQLDSSEYGA